MQNLGILGIPEANSEYTEFSSLHESHCNPAI